MNSKVTVVNNQKDISRRIESIWESTMEGVLHYSYLIDFQDTHVEKDTHLVYSGASMIKPFILDIITHKIYQGELKWTTVVVVDNKHKAQGDGVLQYWDIPITLNIRQACHLMITLSDNTATNALIDFLGGTFEVNVAFYELGYIKSHLRSWVGGYDDDPNIDNYIPSPYLSTQNGISIVNPLEYQECIRQIVKHPTGYKILTQQQDKRSLARTDYGYKFSHKTGTANGIRHDGGILYLPEGKLEVYCFTDGESREESIDDTACVNMSQTIDDTIYLILQNTTKRHLYNI